ncbi:MAG: exonuclease, partial [Polyangiales bacterium]
MSTAANFGDKTDVYFSVDVETHGPIPGPYSLLSFAIGPAGSMSDGRFRRASADAESLYVELQPISEEFEPDAMAVNGLDRARLVREGLDPADAMSRAKDWTMAHAGEG